MANDCKPQPPSPPNSLAELALTIVLPSIVLGHLSAPSRLGPAGALAVSLLFPVAFAAWCWWKRSGWNLVTVIGFVSVLLSGGLGLLELDASWFALKESVMPLALGAAFPLSHRFGKPLINALLMQPHLINLPAVKAALGTPEKTAAYQNALQRGSWGIGLAIMGSSAGTFLLALHLLRGKAPGSEAFVRGIGTLNWASALVIGVPLCAVMLLVFLWLIRRVQSITGLERADLMNPGRTVRRQVGRQPPAGP